MPCTMHQKGVAIPAEILGPWQIVKVLANEIGAFPDQTSDQGATACDRRLMSQLPEFAMNESGPFGDESA